MARSQTIFRSCPNRNFTTLPNSLLQDASLSFEARGMLAFILSHPDDWEIQMSYIIKSSPAGRDKCYRIVKELEQAAYLRKQASRRADGTLGPTEYTAYDTPLPENPEVVAENDQKTPGSSENPHNSCEYGVFLSDSPTNGDISPLPEKPDPVFPDPENQTHTNKLKRQRNYRTKIDSVRDCTCTHSSSRPTRISEVRLAFDAYNEAAAKYGLPRARVLSKARETALRQRLKEIGGLDAWREALAEIGRSKFLRGANNRGWRCNLDFLLAASKLPKVLEGGYRDDGTVAAAPSTNGASDPREGERGQLNDRIFGWWRDPNHAIHRWTERSWREFLVECRAYINGRWPWEVLGPEPGHPECIIPSSVLADRKDLLRYKPPQTARNGHTAPKRKDGHLLDRKKIETRTHDAFLFDLGALPA